MQDYALLNTIFDNWWATYYPHLLVLLSLSAMEALLWYDYALTWTREVQYFWTKRFTLSTLLYVLCRYGMVANILYTLAIADKLPTLRVRFKVLRVVNELNLFLPPQVFASDSSP